MTFLWPELEKNIPKVNHISANKYLKNRNQINFAITHISNEEVVELIQSLPNKGTGPASIPLRMIKDVVDIIVIPLCHIINTLADPWCNKRTVPICNKVWFKVVWCVICLILIFCHMVTSRGVMTSSKIESLNIQSFMYFYEI